MISDKLMIELACEYVYKIALLSKPHSSLLKELYKMYPDIRIREIQDPYAKTNLTAICIEDINSKDVGVVFQGSTGIDNWKNDNLDIFLNKNVDQYDAALDYVESLIAQGLHVTYLSGNSLGGGCAQYVGLRMPHIRALCINASPLTKDALMDSSNIINLRVNADPLYRAIELDPERDTREYAGHIFVVAESLYGSYDYFNTIELAHRGAIVFPTSYLNHQHHVKTLRELKHKVDYDEYMKYYQLTKAPNLGQFLSFDLMTNSLNKSANYDLSILARNFSIRTKEIDMTINKYLLKNLSLAQKHPFLYINSQVNNELRNILRFSLLQITKVDDSLYNNIYYVIEKSSSYFYKGIVKNVRKQIDSFTNHDLKLDLAKANHDLKVNREAIHVINERLGDINETLLNLNFTIPTHFFKARRKIAFQQVNTPWVIDYQKDLFEVIDKELRNQISNNKFFVSSIEKLFRSALKAEKLKLKLMPKSSKYVEVDDIDFILENYNISNMLSKAIKVFKPDLYELLLSESYFYKYRFNITLVNEQYEQLLITLENLANYIDAANFIYRDKRIKSLIEETRQYVKDIMAFNYRNI